MLETARRRKAADPQLASGDVDPQEVLEERQLVPVEEFREVVMQRAPAAARQRELPALREGGPRRRQTSYVVISRRLLNIRYLVHRGAATKCALGGTWRTAR